MFKPNEEGFAEKMMQYFGFLYYVHDIQQVPEINMYYVTFCRGIFVTIVAVSEGDYIYMEDGRLLSMSKWEAKKMGFVEVQELSVEEGDGC